METPEFIYWRELIREEHQDRHRKVWEYSYIAQALNERDMLRIGRRGLGFGVGREPLSALFASFGCEILATDQFLELVDRHAWIETGQHATEADDVDVRDLCPPQLFRQLVRFRPVDMNRIPADLKGFDFLWSCGSLEHIGSLDLGLRFIETSLRCLRPGGVAIHTTEFNLSSNDDTLQLPNLVVYRRRDIESLATRLRSQGHVLSELNFDPGNRDDDRYVDEPPYTYYPHMKLRLGSYVVVSIGLIITKAAEPDNAGIQSYTDRG